MPKRNSTYYRKRLEREHPAIYRDLVAGRYRSVRQAAAAAGLIHLPTRLQNLKREWNRASSAERREFVTWLKSTLRSALPSGKVVATPDGKLISRARAFLLDWLRRNGARPGRIMKAIGFSNYDSRLAQALDSGKPLPKDVLDPLSRWMERNGY